MQTRDFISKRLRVGNLEVFGMNGNGEGKRNKKNGEGTSHMGINDAAVLAIVGAFSLYFGYTGYTQHTMESTFAVILMAFGLYALYKTFR